MRIERKSPGAGKGGRRLSLCMIVRDEEENLAACVGPLRSLLDEVVVIDTGSTDGTREAARRLGARVFDLPWREDFSAARNESIRRATGDYLLWLDGDDRVDGGEVRNLARLKEMLPAKKDKAYYLCVNNQSPVDGETHFHQLRVFPRVPGAQFEGRVHEQIFHRLARLGIELVQTNIVVRHTGYSSPAVVVKKSERNLKLIEKELEGDPENPILHYNAARTLAGINRQAEAVAHMKKVTENRGVREKERQLCLEASLLLGKYYTELKQLEAAGEVFRGLCRDFPDNGLLLFCLGENLFLRKDFQGAREAFTRSLSFPVKVGLFPVNLGRLNYFLYFYLAQIRLEAGDPEGAEEMFRRSLDLHRDHWKSLQALGTLAFKKGRIDEAAGFLERAVRQEEGRTDVNLALLGMACRMLGRDQEAEGALRQALAANPGRAEALVNLGHLRLKERDDAGARQYFETALERSPGLLDSRLALSGIYFRLGELEKLVEQCDLLLADLGLPRDFTVGSFQELGALYARIGHALSAGGQPELSLLAFQVSFLLSPDPEILKKAASASLTPWALNEFLEEARRALAFHGLETAEGPGGLRERVLDGRP